MCNTFLASWRNLLLTLLTLVKFSIQAVPRVPRRRRRLHARRVPEVRAGVAVLRRMPGKKQPNFTPFLPAAKPAGQEEPKKFDELGS